MVEYRHPQDIIDIVLDLKSKFVARDEMFRKIENMVFGKTEIRIPDAYDYYALRAHSPLALFAASTITSTLCSNPLKVQFAPVRQGQVGDENATLRENWHEAAWERQEEDAGRSLYYPWTFNIVTKGLAIQKTLRRTQTMWADYYTFSKKLYKKLKDDTSLTHDQRNKLYDKETEEFKLTSPFPLVTTDVPPESFYYIRGEQGLTLAAECKYVPYNRLVAEFGDRAKSIDPRAFGLGVAQNGETLSSNDEMIPVYELWDDTHVHWVAEGLGYNTKDSYLLGQQEHGLGNPATRTLFGPYAISQGIPTSSRTPELESVGVLYAFMEVLPLLDAVITARGQVAFYTGWPPMERVPRAGPIGGLNPEEIFGSVPTDEEEDDNPVFEPGRIMPVGVRFANPPRSGEELAAFQNSLMEFIAPLLPASAYGAGPAESGYAQNQRIHMNMLVWNPLVKNMQNALAHRFAIEDRLIEQIGEPVYVEQLTKASPSAPSRVKWLPLGPEDIQGGTKYHVLVEPSTPSNDSLLVKQLMDEKMAGWESDYGAIERLGKNYDEIMTQLDVERVMKSEPVQKQIDQNILQELGLGQDEMLQAAMQRLAMLGQAGAGGAPPGMPGQVGPDGMPMNNPAGAGQPGVPNTGPGSVFAPGVNMSPGPPPPPPDVNPTQRSSANPVGTPAGAQVAPSNAYALPGR